MSVKAGQIPQGVERMAQPSLLVCIDTEAEFDWSAPYSAEAHRVESSAALARGQDIFDHHEVRPTYMVDYAIARDPETVARLRGYLESGRCEIGAHLNPWLTPPLDEVPSDRNSFPGNLPADLEHRKLDRLTDAIEESFGQRPRVYRAGRYGLGPNSADILQQLDYRVDLSVMPHTSFADQGGPDFRGFTEHPFWIDERRDLLEIPVTCGYCGLLSRWGADLYPRLACDLGMTLRWPGMAARLGLLERIRLSPEGADLAALRRLTESLLTGGCRVFSLTFHSPSLAVGNTPYVRNDEDLKTLLLTLERYLAYFIGEVGGTATTPMELYDRLRASDDTNDRFSEASYGASILGSSG
jgi:hypothetical protein